MQAEEEKISFNDCVLKSYYTGSRFICNPPVTDTDDDRLVLVNGYYDWEKALLDDGWEPCGADEYHGAEFQAFRKEEMNYIVTESPEFFYRYVLATDGAKALNLANKEDRIKLVEAILHSYGGCDGAKALTGTNFKALVAKNKLFAQMFGAGAARIEYFEMNNFDINMDAERQWRVLD